MHPKGSHHAGGTLSTGQGTGQVMTQEVASIGQLTKCAKVTSQEGTRGATSPRGAGVGDGLRQP